MECLTTGESPVIRRLFPLFLENTLKSSNLLQSARKPSTSQRCMTDELKCASSGALLRAARNSQHMQHAHVSHAVSFVLVLIVLTWRCSCWQATRIFNGIGYSDREGRSTPPPPSMKRKYASKFQDSWLKSMDYDDIAKSHKGERYAHCVSTAGATSALRPGGKMMPTNIRQVRLRVTDTHTHRQTDTTTVTLAAHARRGLITQYMAVGTEVDGVIKAATMFSNWLVHQN